MFGQNTIRKRVLATVNARIEEAENRYMKVCEQIDKEALTKKEVEADKLVSSVLGQ
jgi:hypothetical protein